MDKKSINEAITYNEERFTKRVIFQKGDSTVFILNFMPGQELPAHNHPGTEVYLLVLNGSGTFTINGIDTEVSANDIVHCAGDESLAFKSTGSEPTSLYVMLNKVPDERYVQNI
ncbi:cupin domain-containing protein [Bacillus marasmi]|uniref:cupin domain-containing protein n=1 Tax=Bacillus marasmi TaxID=1926279 RepID=UPI0011CBA8EB|nr:cupin domain-containing protein [Bacillus marasmi]